MQREALNCKIAAMGRALNASQPISRLPIEALAHIFLQLQGSCLEPNQWYVVAAVCRHWYEVANSCASLWRRITFDEFSGLSISHDFFRGSSGISLLRDWGHLAYCPRWDLNDVAMRKHLFNTEHHRLSAAFCAYGNNFRRLFERYAPLTELLELKCDNTPMCHGVWDPDVPHGLGYPGWSYSERYKEALQLPTNSMLFPRLRCLSLVTASFKPNPTPIPSLRRLQLSDCVRMSISMAEFLAFISGCTALEELALRTFRPTDTIFTGASGRAKDNTVPLTPVTLPASLKKLYIHDFPLFTARMLEGMLVSKSTDLTVSVKLDASGDDNTCDLAAVPPLPVYTALPRERAHMDIIRGVNVVHVRFDTSGSYSIVAQRSGHELGIITMTANVVTKVPPDIFTDLIELFGREPITDLTVVVLNPERWTSIDSEDWTRFLCSFPRVERLGVLFHPGDRLPRASEEDQLMTLMGVLGDDRGCGEEIFPVLECLTLHSSDMHDMKSSGDASRTTRIVDCLLNRFVRGHPLSQIRIVHEPTSEYITNATRAEVDHCMGLFERYVGAVSCEDAADFWVHPHSALDHTPTFPDAHPGDRILRVPCTEIYGHDGMITLL